MEKYSLINWFLEAKSLFPTMTARFCRLKTQNTLEIPKCRFTLRANLIMFAFGQICNEPEEKKLYVTSPYVESQTT